MEAIRFQARPDGTRITYGITAARSPAPDRVVVLIHGLASNRSRWSEFAEHTSLDARWSLIRIDLRGHGDSPTSGRISLERWCEDLAAVLDHEGYTRAVIAGHSLGAQVALQFAVQYAGRTAGIVLIDPVYRNALHGRARWLARLSPIFGMAATVTRAMNALGIKRGRVEPLDLRALDEEARVALRDAASTDAFVRRYSSPFEDLKHIRTAHYLQDLAELFRTVQVNGAIEAPVLLVLSSGATFAAPARTREIVAQWSTPSVVTIQAEHWPLTERPVEIRQAIEEWVEGLPATTPTISAGS